MERERDSNPSGTAGMIRRQTALKILINNNN